MEVNTNLPSYCTVAESCSQDVNAKVESIKVAAKFFSEDKDRVFEAKVRSVWGCNRVCDLVPCCTTLTLSTR
jgi:hypothetical protein